MCFLHSNCYPIVVQNSLILPALIIHVSSLVSKWANERTNERSAQAKQAVRSKQMSERCKQTSKYPNTYVPIVGCCGPLCQGLRDSYAAQCPWNSQSINIPVLPPNSHVRYHALYLRWPREFLPPAHSPVPHQPCLDGLLCPTMAHHHPQWCTMAEMAARWVPGQLGLSSVFGSKMSAWVKMHRVAKLPARGRLVSLYW